ncbi:RET-like protein [Mya arenaria]|uniref:RET-like protein n=1 Tax=Mya arenaria TaxID=6604 RepID=A0ABY7DIV0_MYAAR|nr:RET-like protein [Mya arenaria]
MLMFVLLFTGAGSVYVAQHGGELCVPASATPGTTLGRLYAYPHADDDCLLDSIRYELLGDDQNIDINTTSGLLFVKDSSAESRNGKLEFRAKCSSASGEVRAAIDTLTVMRLLTSPPEVRGKQWAEDVCFSHVNDGTFRVEENVEDVALGRLSPCWQDPHIARVYEIDSPKKRFTIDPVTTELRVLRALDRESLRVRITAGAPGNITGQQPLQIMCTVTMGNTSLQVTRRLRVSVLDVNDNPPTYQDGSQTRTVNIETAGAVLVNGTIVDEDTFRALRARVLHDPQGRCRPKALCYNTSHLGHTACLLGVNVSGAISAGESQYQCVVGVEDPGFRPLTGFPFNDTVLEVGADVSGGSATWRLQHDVFRVTPKYGIVYVRDSSVLATSDEMVRLQLTRTSGEELTLAIHLVGKARTDNHCEDGCSFHKDASSCALGCGVGLRGGTCEMRGADSNVMTEKYGTCTYNSSTCPDRKCDELEEMFPALCPQDCIGYVLGEYLPLRPLQPGIVKAKGTCWCDWEEIDTSTTCTCLPRLKPFVTSLSPVDTPPADHSTNVDDVTQLHDVTQISNRSTDYFVAQASQQGTVGCGGVCATGIGLGAGAFLLISFSLFMIWFTKRLNDKRQASMKHVGSVTSLPGPPVTEYTEEEGVITYTVEQWSPKRQIYTAQSPPSQQFSEDVRWEISHCSSQLEEADLRSEFNLLKDVSHPNVIRLIGACTSPGPFYLVVEFCEHGCLLSYLRRSRLQENGYINQQHMFKSPASHEQTDAQLTGDLLFTRDLLSFAWQIAKGMTYLSEIKLVHRDLAARNILVAGNRHLKISDFGLTRDVYEADTYMKKSKGRIPVKWLAPESLYAQIYTTRSDIWSYGIVLWEIVTLGAPPYPGIPPERLYNLLMGGYRMDRPENCADEMYAVMQKCWKIDATDRPSFASLAIIFDRILQEQTGYLDLSQMATAAPGLQTKSTKLKLQEADQHSSFKHALQKGAIRAADACQKGIIEDKHAPTVCNDLYSPDAYLLPLSRRVRRREDKGDGDRETSNQMTPLLDIAGSPESFRTKTRQNSYSVPEPEADTGFRRKSDSCILPGRTSRSKQTVYPCEDVKHNTKLNMDAMEENPVPE